MASLTCAVPRQGEEGWAPPELSTRTLYLASPAGQSQGIRLFTWWL